MLSVLHKLWLPAAIRAFLICKRVISSLEQKNRHCSAFVRIAFRIALGLTSNSRNGGTPVSPEISVKYSVFQAGFVVSVAFWCFRYYSAQCVFLLPVFVDVFNRLSGTGRAYRFRKQ